MIMNVSNINDRLALIIGRAVLRAESLEVQLTNTQQELAELTADRAASGIVPARDDDEPPTQAGQRP